MNEFKLEVTLEAVDQEGCSGCALYNLTACGETLCAPEDRKDGRSVIWVEKSE